MAMWRDAIGRYRRADWSSVDLRVLLLDPASTYVFDATDEFVADLTPGSNELSTTGYARVTLGTSTPTWDAGSSAWRFLADAPVFPALGGTEVVTAAVFFEQVTTDSDSLLISHHTFAGVTLDGTDLTVNLPSGGFLFDASAS